MSASADTSASEDLYTPETITDTCLSFRAKALKVDTEQQAQPIIDHIAKCVNLEVLELAGNTFGVEACQAIGKILETKPTLKECRWSDIFTSRLRPEIPPSLISLGLGIMTAQANLVVIDLSDNAFGPDGINSIYELMTSPSAFTIQELYFNNNGLGLGGETVAKALIECHRKAQQSGVKFQLKTLVAGRNRLENPCAKALASAFQILTTLEVIRLPQNGIQKKGIELLAQSFRYNPNLKEIDLSDNIFTAKGAGAVASVLPDLTSLKVINFSDCLITNEGAEILAESILPNHINLEILNIGYNEIQASGAYAICEKVSELPAIKSLLLDGNKLGESVIESITVRLASSNKDGILGSMSDDEGSDGDGDDDDEDDDNNNQDNDSQGSTEEISDENDDTSKKDQMVISKVKLENGHPSPQILSSTPQNEKNGTPQISSNATTFINSPSPESLVAMGDTCIPTILEVLYDEDNFESLSATFVRIASIYNKCTELKLQSLIIDILDNLVLNSICKFPNFVNLFVQQLLVHYGLIKSEEKRFVPEKDLSPQFSVLKQICCKPYFTKDSKNTMITFLQRSNTNSNKLNCPEDLGALMSSLYS